MNRLTEKSYPDTSTVNYTYDNDSRLTQVTDPTGTYSFTLDNMGRLAGTTTQYAFLTGRHFTTSYSYDAASNRTGFTDPETGATAYVYDTLNRLETLTPPSAFTTKKVISVGGATVQRGIGLCGFILIVSCWLTIAAIAGQGAPQGLKPDEYDGVALIYNQELSALGNRALFPICIGMPSGMPTEPLVRYLRKGGFEISDEAVCEPAMAPGGQHHPKDYSHGLRIFIDKLQRDPAGVISMRVQADDLTVRPGEHFAQTLRRGTYQLKQDQAGKWQIAGYTKEYDSADEKG